jgi:hypothetical protein
VRLNVLADATLKKMSTLLADATLNVHLLECGQQEESSPHD